MDNALEIITKNFEDIITSDKGHCTRVITTKDNKTWYFDIYQDMVLVFDGINEQIELNTEDELKNYIADC